MRNGKLFEQLLAAGGQSKIDSAAIVGATRPPDPAARFEAIDQLHG